MNSFIETFLIGEQFEKVKAYTKLLSLGKALGKEIVFVVYVEKDKVYGLGTANQFLFSNFYAQNPFADSVKSII